MDWKKKKYSEIKKKSDKSDKYKQKNRKTEKQKNRQTDKQKNRQTDKFIYPSPLYTTSEIQTNRLTETNRIKQKQSLITIQETNSDQIHIYNRQFQ